MGRLWCQLSAVCFFGVVAAGCGSRPPEVQDRTSAVHADSSGSKLGVHVSARPAADPLPGLLAAHPRVVKWLLPGMRPDESATQWAARCRAVRASMADYRRTTPDGVVVLRVFVPKHGTPDGVGYTPSDDPASSADDFWSRMQPALDAASIVSSDVDWLEGPNELDNLPNGSASTEATEWIAAFWARLGDAMQLRGFRPMVGSLAPRSAPSLDALAEGFCPTVSAMRTKPYPWAWSYHSYATDLSPNAEANAMPLGYRVVRTRCPLTGIPLVLSEGGALVLDGGPPAGWQSLPGSDTERRDGFVQWLLWFDGQMLTEPDLIGLTVYQLGDTGAAQGSFEISAIAPALTALIAR